MAQAPRKRDVIEYPCRRSLTVSGRSWIDRQRNVLAERRLQTLDGAILIAAARATADADGADHLSVDNNRDAARVREEIEISQ